jgi:hypothetical protein
MKEVTIDLRTASLFGPSCKCLEMLEDFRYRGYRVNFIGKDWAGDCKESGVTFDKNTGSFKKGNSRFLWDPKQHPVDFYENLIVPTFENLNFHYKPLENTILGKFKKHIRMLFSPSYFTHIHSASMYMEPLELKRYQQQKVDDYYDKKNVRSLFDYLHFLLQIKLSSSIKVYPDSKGFRYKLREELLDDNVKKVIEEAQLVGVPYVLIAANWDDEKKFERQDDRIRGVLYDEVEFNSMVSYVKKLDRYAQEGKIRLVLASKKAADWDKVIQSDFLDLRTFEEKGLSLSQSIYVLQEITKLTINWPSTFSIWMTHCSGILHLTWRDNKDTAAWARNRLHQKPVERALELIGTL